MQLKFISFLVIFFMSNVLLAQHDHTAEGHVHHDHHPNELGIANSAVYFLKEKEVSYGLHIHFVKRIAASKFGAGLAYERIFDEHKHSTYGVVLMFTPINRLNFIVSPGVTLEAESTSPTFALHVETSYEFEVGNNMHIGPALEWAYDKEDIHLSIGLHVGFGF